MNSQAYRIADGGLIDRSRRLEFRFDGKAYQGYAGDTLASALLANGVRLFGRSFKYHRRRGVMGLGFDEPNALVRMRPEPRAEPNVRATQAELYDGLYAESQNRWPTLEMDLGAINDLASRLLPAGFYYKTFMWPGSWWMFYERFIRQAAGLGRPSLQPDPDVYAKRFAHCDVLVVGAGPAGIAAARSAAAAGIRVMLVEDDFIVGGSLLGQPAEIDGQAGPHWAESAVEELQAKDNVQVLKRAVAFGYYDQNLVAVHERVWDHVPIPPDHQPRQRLWWIRAKRVVLASGALERPLVFANNDLPGVMLASAAQGYANRYAVKCGDKAVLFANNDQAYASAGDLHRAGVRIHAVVDPRPDGASDSVQQLLPHGVEILKGQVVTRALGREALRAVAISGYNANEEAVSAVEHIVECDLLCMSGGYNPSVHLFSQSQGKLRYDPGIATFVPREAAQQQVSAGAANGTFDLGQVLAAGNQAGIDMAAAAAGKRRKNVPAPEVTSESPSQEALLPLWSVPLAAGRRGKRFVDFQNDVTAEDVSLAAREGYLSVEHLKRYTTLGMGTDQGRTSNVNGLAIMSTLTGRAIPEVGTTTFRPPFAPVTLGAIAAKDVGAHFAPVRRTPMHEWHARAGAPFVTAGPWMRPQCYPAPGESLADAINREAVGVRTAVGMVDVSTLGKIEVRGRDAAEFLERVYINRWTTLKVGRVRYGFMLREDGFVMDDGTTTRIGENEFYMTTTTGGAGPVMAHLERYAQTVWPQLHVHLTSVSDQWGGFALAGPKARQVLQRACQSADVSNEGLPFMAYTEATVEGMPVRIFRMTFSGELAYEVHMGADHALPVWEAFMTAGQPFGIFPYGTEAMSVLRIEKGHVVAAELDGTTIPSDFSVDGMYARKRSDFIGRRSLERPGLDGSHPRMRLAGLTSLNGEHIPRGAQLVTNPTKPKPIKMHGHVTSTTYSPNLGKEIALALLEAPDDWKGKTLYAASPVADAFVPVRVGHPVFIDPQGGRARV